MHGLACSYYDHAGATPNEADKAQTEKNSLKLCSRYSHDRDRESGAETGTN